MYTRGQLCDLLREREALFREVAGDLAVFLVFDRPERVSQRPGLDRVLFRQRCVSDQRLDSIIASLRSVGAWVRVFRGEDEFLSSLASGSLGAGSRGLRLVYNGIEGGIAHDGFAPGRKALIPAVSDSYEMKCANSNPYACALGRHKYHYFTVLRAHGIPCPEVWHYRPGRGWAGGCIPTAGTRVIAKSTYESWSVGVTDESIFVADDGTEERVAEISRQIGQAVCVQRFVPGSEVGVTVLALPEVVATPPIQVVLHKAPNDPDAVMTMEDNLQANAYSYRALAASDDLLSRLQGLAIECYQTLELDAFARIDFRIAEDGEPWVSDVGISPGLGPPGSSSFESFRYLGLTYSEFIRIVMVASLINGGSVSP